MLRDERLQERLWLIESGAHPGLLRPTPHCLVTEVRLKYGAWTMVIALADHLWTAKGLQQVRLTWRQCDQSLHPTSPISSQAGTGAH
jgi:hypothetical protein